MTVVPRAEALRLEGDRAEQVLLGAIIVQPAHLPVVAEIVTATDFRLERHRAVFAAITALDESSQPVDILTVRRQLAAVGAGVTAEQLGELADGVPRATNIEHYAGMVAQAATLRRVESAALEVIQACKSGDSAEDVLTRAQSVMLAIGANRQRGKGLEPFREALREAHAELQSAVETGHSGGLSYGLADLDALTGGLHASELIVIGARPSRGKSALAFHIARSVAKTNAGPIALFSIEMSRSSVALRVLAAEGMVDTNAAKSGSASEASWGALLTAMATALKWPLWVDDAGTISVVEIAARCRRLKADQGGLAIVLVDYLQLIRATKAENRTQEIGAISRGLKQLAKDLEVPVVALAQLNRSADGARPMLSHLRESGDIEADADAVLLLHRPDEDDESAIEIIVAKQRNGPTGTVPVYFRREHQRFESVAKEEMFP